MSSAAVVERQNYTADSHVKNLKTQNADIRKKEVQWQRVRNVGVLGSVDTKT